MSITARKILRHILRRTRGWVRPRGLILMYHRVAEVELDPWSLSVTPQRFDEHLQVLREHRHLLGLSQLVDVQRRGRIPRGAVAITFDDGHADNLHTAKPLLQRHGVPATVFVAAGQVDSQREFWWDELERIMLRPGRLPDMLELQIDNTTRRWDVGTASNYGEADYRRDRTLRAWEAEPGSRMALYYSVWSVLRTLPYGARTQALDALLTWAGAPLAPRAANRAVTRDELHALMEGGLVGIGAHTMTHPSLPAHPLAVQKEEIRGSKVLLEHMLGREITSFAFPFGDFTLDTIALVREAGFTVACTTRAGSVGVGGDTLQLPRFEVRNWSKDEFARGLRRWM
jgi:peptidoglycan/xylan/chitin deacetylase (PgdA/CDA1 family)